MPELSIQKYRLELNHPFRITHSSRMHQTVLIISLHHDGITGIGEAALPSYYQLNIDALQDFFLQQKNQLEALQLTTPEQFWQAARPVLGEHPPLQCALDIAAYDWYGKKNNKPLYRLWDLDIEQSPMSSYTIGWGTEEEMLEKMMEMPWPIYKIKLGVGDDLERIQTLRKNSDAIFRIDANTGWSAAQTIQLSAPMKALQVEYIEQPTPPDQMEEMDRVKLASQLPLIADESCQVMEDVEKCAPHFHGVNIKIMKCGGLTPALEMIKKARALKLKVMLGCMIESSVAISAAAQLLPLADYADLDSILLIKYDPADGVKLEEGKFIYNQRPGIGAVMTT